MWYRRFDHAAVHARRSRQHAMNRHVFMQAKYNFFCFNYILLFTCWWPEAGAVGEYTRDLQRHSFFIWLKCINNCNLFITWRSAIWVLFIYWLRRHWQRSWLCNMQSIVCVHVVRPEGNVNLHMIFILFADIGHADANRLCMTAGDLGGGLLHIFIATI